jgi:hypothetical protein
VTLPATLFRKGTTCKLTLAFDGFVRVPDPFAEETHLRVEGGVQIAGFMLEQLGVPHEQWASVPVMLLPEPIVDLILKRHWHELLLLGRWKNRPFAGPRLSRP